MLADEELKVKLAVSLHSAREEIRNRIMPFSEKFPLTELLESLQYWYQKTKSKITFEYLVWKDINDRQTDIDALVRYAKRVPSKINLIEYNPIGESEFEQAHPAVIEAYTDAIQQNGIVVKVRRSRGKDIDAACGQLANKSLEEI